MMAAISAASNGNKVILVEKMNSLGRKLLITGKGRCNITSSLPIEEFIKNIPGNGRFLYSAFQNYSNEDIIDFMEEQGVKVKEERGNRIFPVSDKSVDVLDAFLKRLKQLNVQIRTNSEVEQILTEEECYANCDDAKNSQLQRVVGIRLKGGEILNADKVILATGGKSYPSTGSTGDGYGMAKMLGHTVTEIRPSLVPLSANKNEETEQSIVKDVYKNSLSLCKELQGLSLKNVAIKILDVENKKCIYEDFGEMIFTHFGVSGPTILSGSAHLLRYKNVQELLKQGKIVLSIDLKPALTEEKLDARILRDFEKFKNRALKNSLDELLPQKLIKPIIELSKIDEEKKTNGITKEERQRLTSILKNLKIIIEDFRPIEDAIITAGGINIKEINPKTMESKLVSGLHFAGEIIDVDAYTGGFNLQIAYSTGYTAGL